MKIPFLILSVTLQAAMIQAGTPVEQHPVMSTVQVLTADSLKLFGVLQKSSLDRKAPLIVMLPMMANTHISYNTLCLALHRAAKENPAHPTLPVLLTLDMRGHGKSTQRGAATLDAKSMGEEEFAKMPEDVRAMITQVIADTSYHIDTSNIIVIGASIGANSAAMLTSLLPNVKKVVMLSPGKDYHGLQPEGAVKAYKGDMLIYVSKGDSYSLESSQYLADLNKDHCTLVTFEGDNHGTDIINKVPGAMAQLVNWVLK
ncbi:MAG TPA: alpha/beta hydrolase [Candidatus Acidoferrum sp.]|nr:alpha/beta hydrolase [Candidatus Acidoferrum sp.]